MSSTTELLEQLNALLRLTQTEIMTAEARRAQAADDDVERELAANADTARQRSHLLTDMIRSLGGAPDVTGIVIGRMNASSKALVEQSVSLTDALVGDLRLEHELLDRTKLARMIAERLEQRQVAKVLDRLEIAHGATIDWLMTRLAEIAMGGPVALRPSPAQAVAGFARRVGTLPARQSAEAVNRSVERIAQLRTWTGEVISTNVDRTRQLVEAAGSIWTAGRDASLKRSEEIAGRRGDRGTARRVNRARRDLGAVDADEVPIRRYDTLTADTAVQRVGKLDDPDDVRAVLAYESAHKSRKTVIAAAQDRIEELAEQLVAAS